MLDLLKNRSFFIVWLGHAISSLGNTFSAFSIAYLIYDMTGSKLAMGSIMVVFFVSRSTSLLWFGPYLDKWDRKKVMIFSEWSGAIVFLFPLIMFSLGSLEIWHLVAVLGVTGLTVPLYQPSCLAYISQILPKEKLLKGNSIMDSTGQLMMLVGPALSGVLLYSFGVKVILISLVLLLGIAGALLLFATSTSHSQIKEQESWGTRFKEGISIYKEHTFLLWLALLLVVLNFCKGAFFPMFLPYITEVIGGTTFHFGLFESSFGLGMILGTLWVGFKKTNPKHLRTVILGSVIVDGLFSMTLGWVFTFALAALCIIVSGFCMPVMTVNNTTLYQKNVPGHLLARVFSVRILLTTIATPLGAISGGAIAELWGIPMLFTLIGLLMIFASSMAFFLPSLRKLNSVDEKERSVVGI
ncbi:MAG TPA: MFS transporter [Pseudoneobacillus sp.]|nr:MFS transporter [Pseudoneobacillus sp.]